MTGPELLQRQRDHACIVCGAPVFDWEDGLLFDGFPFNECPTHRDRPATKPPRFDHKAERAKGVAILDQLLAAPVCGCGLANECPRGASVIETSVEVSVRCTHCGRTGVRSTNLDEAVKRHKAEWLLEDHHSANTPTTWKR